MAWASIHGFCGHVTLISTFFGFSSCNDRAINGEVIIGKTPILKTSTDLDRCC